jgi:hypothetical protein
MSKSLKDISDKELERAVEDIYRPHLAIIHAELLRLLQSSKPGV